MVSQPRALSRARLHGEVLAEGQSVPVNVQKNAQSITSTFSHQSLSTGTPSSPGDALWVPEHS